jgi:two-component system nitrogen regulation sensor histidine kinase NtrY
MTRIASVLADMWQLSPVIWLRKNTTLVLIVAGAISAIFTYTVMTGEKAPLGIKPQRIWLLMAINATLLILLLASIGRHIFGLWRALRSDSAGSRLQKRILLLFSIVTITPTIMVSVFSALFFNFGIQVWFNDRVQTAVDESLAVAEAYLAEHRENIRADALAMTNDLNQYADLLLVNPAEFNRILVVQSGLRVLSESVIIQQNRIIAQGRLSFALAFEHIPQDLMERASQGEVVILPADNDKVRALVKLDAFDNAFLLVGRLIDGKVVSHMKNTQGAVSEYEMLETQLDRLQVIFSVVFIMLALLLLLCSVGYGMVFAARLTNPISSLVMAAERVRGGDFSARVKDTNNSDEIGLLARSFNRMTEQLQAQRSELIEANRRLDERRRFSEAVLSGVSAGVIALDREKAITLANRSASFILNTIEQPVTPGTAINEALPGIQELLSQAEHLPGDVAQNTLTINKNNNSITLHVRITVEKLGEEIEGFIVTFDDITELVSAQRTAAWADVARRVAHEIKNPLTPIQLAAERLKRKYAKYIHDDVENFTRYTDTIAKQVDDIGRMVEEFVSFARMPTPVFAHEDVCAIIRKSVFSAQTANPAIDYNLALPNQPVMLFCDERQMTQILTNLLKNASEAIDARIEKSVLVANEGVTKTTYGEKGRIDIALLQDNQHIILNIRDNGIGFPSGDPKNMLEPYITTRNKGTGLGLAIVKKILEEHKGKITLENNVNGGAIVSLYFPITV